VVCSRLCGGMTVVEAAHTNVLGPRGLGQKTSDYSAVPLCSGHHRENPDSYHRLGEADFGQEHKLELAELVAALNSRFRQLVLEQNRPRLMAFERKPVAAQGRSQLAGVSVRSKEATGGSNTLP